MWKKEDYCLPPLLTDMEGPDIIRKEDGYMEQTFMKEQKILPLVLSMSTPMVISMAVNALYNIVDSYFVAKLNEEAMTALALVYPVQNVINAIAIGFAIGINAAIALYLGAGDQENGDKAAAQGMLLNLLHGVVLALLCIGIMPGFLRLFSSDERVISLALEYSRRVFVFAPVITVGLVFEKLFQAVGRMKISMFSMMCGCVANILLDPLMIFGAGIFPALGIAGAAYATGMGQMVTLAVYLFFYKTASIPVKIKKSGFRLDRGIVARLYSVGISASLNLALPSLLISALNGILAEFSDKYVLVLGVYYKLQTFIYLTANGIIQGIRPLMGYNYGAGEKGRVREIFHTTLALTAGVMAVGTILSWAVPAWLMGLFTDQGTTLENGVWALRIISLGFVVSAVSVTCSGALEGLGKGTPSLYISLLRYIIVIIPLAFLLSRVMGAEGVWWAFCATEFITAGIACWIYRRSVDR